MSRVCEVVNCPAYIFQKRRLYSVHQPIAHKQVFSDTVVCRRQEGIRWEGVDELREVRKG